MSRGLAIPSIMLGGPIGGAIAGYFIGSWMGAPDKGIAFGVLAGIALAAFEVVRLIRQMSSEKTSSDKKPDRRSRE